MCRRRGGVAVGVLNGFLYAVGESIKLNVTAVLTNFTIIIKAVMTPQR